MWVGLLWRDISLSRIWVDKPILQQNMLRSLVKQLQTTDELPMQQSWNQPDRNQSAHLPRISHLSNIFKPAYSNANSYHSWPEKELTVFKLKIPATFSHSLPFPLLTSHPSSFLRPLARHSTRSLISLAVKVLPDIPHVYGFLDLSNACRPFSSLNINSKVLIESGGAESG